MMRFPVHRFSLISFTESVNFQSFNRIYDLLLSNINETRTKNVVKSHRRRRRERNKKKKSFQTPLNLYVTFRFIFFSKSRQWGDF